MEEKFEVRNREIEARLNDIGVLLKAAMPENWGFVLVMSSLGENGAAFYLSSIERESTINLMEEMFQKLKGRQADAGREDRKG